MTDNTEEFEDFDEADSVEIEADLAADSYNHDIATDDELGCEE